MDRITTSSNGPSKDQKATKLRNEWAVSFPAAICKVMAVVPGSFDCPGEVVIGASLS